MATSCGFEPVDSGSASAAQSSASVQAADSSDMPDVSSIPASDISSPDSFVEYPSSEQEADFGESSSLSQIIGEVKGASAQKDTPSSDGQNGGTSSAATVSEVTGTNDYQPVSTDETKAIWISYQELAVLLRGKSQSAFEANLKQVYQNIRDLGLNTVIVQARPYSDALYPSEYYPWSSYASGAVGQAPSFDPLAVMVTLAHKAGLSFHAWLNPLRGMTQEETSKVPSTYLIRQWHDSRSDSDRLVYSGSRWYLNPAYPEVRSLIANGAAEIASRYDVDGIHIDDYFYPTTDASFDKLSYETYGGGKTLSQFRLDNCSQMVKEIYQTVKKANSKVLFGVSPQGNIQNNYTSQFADVKRWCSEKGYLDYIMPQVYFGFENEGQPYSQTVRQWNELIKADGIQLMIGLACHKIGMEDDTYAGSGSREWSEHSDILSRQVSDARAIARYSGVALFDYKSLFDLSTGDILTDDSVQKEVSKLKEVLSQ